MHWKLRCRNKKQNKKILRLTLYGKIRNARLKLEQMFFKKSVYWRIQTMTSDFNMTSHGNIGTGNLKFIYNMKFNITY